MSPRKKDPLDTIKDAPTRNLYKAIVAYIESGGGTAVVVGGIEVQGWPGDARHNYRVAVRITGRTPKFAVTSEDTK